nr:MAG TPA: hypothetical protein [Caudoviricetes sp.]
MSVGQSAGHRAQRKSTRFSLPLSESRAILSVALHERQAVSTSLKGGDVYGYLR